MATFEPEMINLLATIVEEAWAKNPRGSDADRGLIAERVVKAALRGERDPNRLRVISTMDVVRTDAAA